VSFAIGNAIYRLLTLHIQLDGIKYSDTVQLPAKAKFWGRHNSPWPLLPHNSTDRPSTIVLVIVVTETHKPTPVKTYPSLSRENYFD